MISYEQDMHTAVRIARLAGAVVLGGYRKVDRLTKTHAAAQQEAVTQTDRDSQRVVIEQLKLSHPHDGIIGEEDDTGAGITLSMPDPDGRVWVIDPIDGTNNFIAGLGNFAVCIGLLHKGMPVAGAVYDVTRDLMYSAAQGVGCFVNDQPSRVISSPLSDSSMLMLTSNLLSPQGKLPGFVSRWMGQTTWKIRVLGSAAVEAAQVAGGVAHGAVTINGKLWDVAAPAALVLAAGGKVTTLAGQDLFPFKLAGYAGAKVPFIAAGPQALDTIVKEINH